MNFRMIKGGLALSACIVTLAGFAAPAAADPFSEAFIATINPLSTNNNNNCDVGGPYQCHQTNSSTSTVTESYSQNGPGFATSIYAQANLATATLKSKAAASTNDGQSSPYVQSNAIFSDGFKTTNTASNTPFVWNDATATFNLHLGSSNLLNESGPTSAVGFVILGINSYGSTNVNSNWYGNSSSVFVYTFGNDTSVGYGYEDPITHVVTGYPLQTTEHFDTVPTDISAPFQPHGDFDWVLLFGISGQPGFSCDSDGNCSVVPASFDYDFSHTLTLQYQGPEGTSFTSDSGIFGSQKEAAVPEPLTLSLFGAGFAGMAALRRRKAKSA